MENKIYIKSYFSDWREVSKEEAKKYITNFYNRIMTTSDHAKRCELIDNKFLKGITTDELLKD